MEQIMRIKTHRTFLKKFYKISKTKHLEYVLNIFKMNGSLETEQSFSKIDFLNIFIIFSINNLKWQVFKWRDSRGSLLN